MAQPVLPPPVPAQPAPPPQPAPAPAPQPQAYYAPPPQAAAPPQQQPYAQPPQQPYYQQPQQPAPPPPQGYGVPPPPGSGYGQPPRAPAPPAFSPAAMPVPRPVPSVPPSTVASLDALPKDAKKKATYAMVMFFISGIVFFAGGIFYYLDMTAALAANRAVDQGTLWGFIGLLLVFGILAFLFAIVDQIRVIGSMRVDKWDTAVDTAVLLALPGFIFGLFFAGFFLFMMSRKMRSHPFYIRTLPPPTPVCERCHQPVQWVAPLKKWYCPNCHIYL